ncbi:MAG: 30S ribosome-binding factor RbfA [Thermoguttaceae bacterium]|jgi:ribosome-binding factor A
MVSRRTLKVAEAVREVVAMSILTDLKDPRVEGATITRVEVSGDLRQAKVYFSVLGGESKERNVLRGLQSSAGYLQQKVAKRVEMRYTPTLLFFVDEGIKNLIEVSRVLAEEKARREELEAARGEGVLDSAENENEES